MMLPFVGGMLLIIVMLVGNTLFPLIETIVKNGIPLHGGRQARRLQHPHPARADAAAGDGAGRGLGRQPPGARLGDHGHPHGRGPAAPPVPADLSGRPSPALARSGSGTGSSRPPTASSSRRRGRCSLMPCKPRPTVAANKVFTFQDYSFHIREIRKDPGGNTNKLQLLGSRSTRTRPSPDGFPTLITAKSADYDHDVWTLYDAHVMTFGRGRLRRASNVGQDDRP